MLPFRKYNSIENSYDTAYVERIRSEGYGDLRYVVQEKVHGSNVCLTTDGTDIMFGKRTGLVLPGESFYDYREMLDRYRERVLRLFGSVKDRYSDLETLSVYGEMFGGRYPHPAVPAVRGASVIQRGVYYSPSHEFYGFDLLIRSSSIPQPPVTSIGDMESPTVEDGERYLGVWEVSELFALADMLYAKVLFEGSLSECISYPNAFITKIPEWLGLPALEDNICEGIVIRPVEACFLTSGSRVLLKSKNDRFKEKSHLRRGGTVEPSYSPELSLMLDTIASYVTENRLSNVLSKIGEVSFPHDIGRVMGMLSRDALEDFIKENECAYMELDRAEQKLVTKRASVLSAELIKGNIGKTH